jgi:hypothetical protein
MALETEVEVLKSVVNKLDQSLEKISQVSDDIGKLLAVHDAKITQLVKESDIRTDDVKDINARIATQTKEILSKIDDMEMGIEIKMAENSVASREQHKEIQNEIKNDILNIEKSNKDSFKALDARVTVLEVWRWYILGGVAVILFLFSNLNTFSKLFN